MFACYLIAQLADFLPTVTITAKILLQRQQITMLKKENLFGEKFISDEHVQNNESIRGLLAKRGIKPEKLPPAKDLKKLERKVKSDEKSLSKKVLYQNNKLVTNCFNLKVKHT